MSDNWIPERMDVDGAHVRMLYQHGQQIFIPSLEGWKAILDDGHLGGIRMTSPDNARAFVEKYFRYEAIRLGLVLLRGRWWSFPLLCVEGHLYRVHFEDVICEHCHQRCGLSATPDTVCYAGTGLSVAEVYAEFERLGVKQCPHCSGLLRRRQTAWFAPPVVDGASS